MFLLPPYIKMSCLILCCIAPDFSFESFLIISVRTPFIRISLH